jgi:hypothetical protein
VNIRFQQSQAHLAHGSIYIRLRKFSPSAKILEDLVQSFTERLEQ